jgi:hypothetical protein
VRDVQDCIDQDEQEACKALDGGKTKSGGSRLEQTKRPLLEETVARVGGGLQTQHWEA